MRKALLALVLSAFSFPLFAQPALEPVLIPVWWKGEVPGAFGAIWRVDLSVVNNSPTKVTLYPYAECANMDACVLQKDLPQGVTVFPPLMHFFAVRGYLLGVSEGRAKDLDFTLRVRDVSQATHDWGTEIPVVTLDDAVRGPLGLPDVPVSAGFRPLLRVYTFDPQLSTSVHVAVFEIDVERDPLKDDTPDKVLFETELAVPASEDAVVAPYAELSLSIPAVTAASRVRVEIKPTDSTLPYWAFVSVTNNETQRITTVTP